MKSEIWCVFDPKDVLIGCGMSPTEALHSAACRVDKTGQLDAVIVNTDSPDDEPGMRLDWVLAGYTVEKVVVEA